MFRTWKLAPNTVAQRLAALRFLYIQVLKRGWSAAETPYPKKVLHLPEILTQGEVARLIAVTATRLSRVRDGSIPEGLNAPWTYLRGKRPSGLSQRQVPCRSDQSVERRVDGRLCPSQQNEIRCSSEICFMT